MAARAEGVNRGRARAITAQRPTSTGPSRARKSAPDRRHSLRAATGSGWAHLGWMADPERGCYRIRAAVVEHEGVFHLFWSPPRLHHIYQSFDLEEWQYVGAALRARPGRERNSAALESPQVTYDFGSYAGGSPGR